MKTFLWESSGGAGASLINSKSFVFATLYTITLFGSQGVIRLTDADVDIAYNGLSFSSKGPFIDLENSKATAHWKRGLDVDTWTLAVLPRNVDPVTGVAYPDQIGSTPWIAAARGGALDGADIQIDRAYFAAWPQPYRAAATPVGVLTVFAGRPAEVDCTDSTVVITINDYRELLLEQLPRNLFQAGCGHTLFDSGCALTAASFAKTGTVLSGPSSSRSFIYLSAGVKPPLGSADYSLGRIVMTGGLNSGFSRTIVNWDAAANTASLLNPLPFTVGIGDAYTIYPGCKKTQGACTAFGNLANYNGTDFVPDATTAV